MHRTIFDPSTPGRMRISVCGEFSFDELHHFFAEINDVENPDAALLLDITELETDNIRSIDIDEIMRIFNKIHPRHIYRKIAILVRTDVQHTMSMQFKDLTESRTITQVSIFHCQVEADKWLTDPE